MRPAREFYTQINEALKRARTRPIATSSEEVRTAKLQEIDARIQTVIQFSSDHAEHRSNAAQLLASLQEERQRVATSNPDIIAEEQREATLAVLKARLNVAWSYYMGLRENYRYYMREAEQDPKPISWRNADFNSDEPTGTEPSVDK